MVDIVIHQSRDLRIEGPYTRSIVQISTYRRYQNPPLMRFLTSGVFDEYDRLAFSPSAGRIILYGPAASDWSDMMEDVHSDAHCQTDFSHSRSVFVLHGSKTERFLQSLVAIDLSIAAFPVGKGVATVYHDAPLYLIRRDEDNFHCLVARSFRQDFEAVLTAVARGWIDV